MNKDRVLGCILGLAIGDAFGAPFEGGPLERALWRLIGTSNGKRRWTDDTQMSLDTIESLIACRGVDAVDLASRYAASYRWSRGYGPAAGKILKRIRRGESWQEAGRSVYPEGSFGNGGAMRAPVAGLFFAGKATNQILEAAHAIASVTHAHPLGYEGAGLIALATSLSVEDASNEGIIRKLEQSAVTTEYQQKLFITREWLEFDNVQDRKTVVRQLGNGIAATESVVTAIYTALSFREAAYDDLLEFVISLGGDVDTIAAMSSAIWGASRGLAALPEDKLQSLEQYDEIVSLAETFAQLQ
jgi:ADP-ribosylglycohydrolase